MILVIFLTTVFHKIHDFQDYVYFLITDLGKVSMQL